MFRNGVSQVDFALAAHDKTGRPHARRLTSIDDEFCLHPLPEDAEPGLLGKGGFGVVKRYRRLNKAWLKHIPEVAVAVKRIDKSRLKSYTALKHVCVEIAVLRHFKHENVIKLYDVVHTADAVYMIMELIDGHDLWTFLRKQENGRLSSDKAAVVVKQLFTALEYIHSAKVVHRDIKLENILIGANLHIKVIDFGLAKYCGSTNTLDAALPPQSPIGDPAGGSPMVASTPCGTDLYMALETICGALDGHGAAYISSRSRLAKVDVYGAGVVAYALLIGALPYETRINTANHEGRMQDMKRLISQGVSFKVPSSVETTVPLCALEAVRDMLANDASVRCTSKEALSLPWLSGVALPYSILANVQVVDIKQTAKGGRKDPIIPQVRRSPRRPPPVEQLPSLVGSAEARDAAEEEGVEEEDEDEEEDEEDTEGQTAQSMYKKKEKNIFQYFKKKGELLERIALWQLHCSNNFFVAILFSKRCLLGENKICYKETAFFCFILRKVRFRPRKLP